MQIVSRREDEMGSALKAGLGDEFEDSRDDGRKGDCACGSG